MNFNETLKMTELARKRRALCNHLNRYRAQQHAAQGGMGVDLSRVLFARLFPQPDGDDEPGGNVHPIKPPGTVQ